jgi:hypothetical protein
MDIRLVALDLDGTLLGEDYQLSPAMELALLSARRLGLIITLATNRMEASARLFARRLGLREPIISFGGALVRPPDSSHALLDLRIEKDLARQALRTLKGPEIFRFVFQQDRAFTDRETWYSVRYGEILGVPIHAVEDLEAILDDAPTAVVFRTPPEEASKASALLSRIVDGRARLLRSLPHYIEILHREATKGRGLQALLEHYGLDQKQCMAVGDGINDLEMLEAAGLGVAVANAHQRLKASADYVSSNPRERGVFEALVRWCGIAWEGLS